MAFKDLGKSGDERDTLYFNAFTEDLFNWDNDLENDRERVLRINKDSRFFAGLDELEMNNRIRPLLNRYADFDFRIDTNEWEVSFSREIESAGARAVAEDIKVSRGEENTLLELHGDFAAAVALWALNVPASCEGEDSPPSLGHDPAAADHNKRVNGT